MNPQETVEAFVAAWNRRDLDAVYAMMADDVVWENVPLGVAEGIGAVRAMMDGFPPIEACDWTIHAIAANGGTVLTERTDGFTLAGGRQAKVRVMGVFEIGADGRIAAWRDYFDSAEFQREFGG